MASLGVSSTRGRKSAAAAAVFAAAAATIGGLGHTAHLGLRSCRGAGGVPPSHEVDETDAPSAEAVVRAAGVAAALARSSLPEQATQHPVRSLHQGALHQQKGASKIITGEVPNKRLTTPMGL